VIKFSWLIPSLPLAAFFLIVVVGRRMPRGGAEIGILAVALAHIWRKGGLEWE